MIGRGPDYRAVVKERPRLARLGCTAQKCRKGHSGARRQPHAAHQACRMIFWSLPKL
jgi:hypothetical protein